MANRYPLLSFTSGELTPQIDARSDIDKYRSGCRTLENMIPRIYGPATRRPGTKYIDTCSGVSRVIPFIYSDTIAYIVLMEDQKFYFYYNGGRVLDGSGDRLDVDTPYLAADLNEVQFKQSNDVMWLVHGSYAPRKLSRTSATAFSLDQITFNNGPFKKRNDLDAGDGVTMAPSATSGTGTLTASGNVFDADHVGALFSIIQPRVNTTIDGSMTNPNTGVIGGTSILTEGSFTLTLRGTWTGTVELQRSVDNATWETYKTWTAENGDANTMYTNSETESGIYFRVNVTSLSANTGVSSSTTSKVRATFTVNSSTQRGICRVTGYTSATSVSMTVLKDFASTDADVRWAEGCWSAYRGYPKAMTFFENRAVYAGTDHQPQTVWFSGTDDFEDFDECTKDDSSFTLTMSSDTRNAIQWIASLEALIVGTSGGEWRIRSSAYDEPLTPSNFSFKKQTTYGSKSIQALPVNDVILMVDRVGRKVREVTYSGDKDKYVAPDLTALAEHITLTSEDCSDSGIVAHAFQMSPDPIYWACLADGALIAMTYEREQNVIGWSRQPFLVGGTTYDYSTSSYGPQSVAVIPTTKEDEIWLIVHRTINGSDVRYLEQMQPRVVEDQEDQWFVDSGLDYDGTANTAFSGLDHLEGEEVVVLADGAVQPSVTVTNGAITISEAASRVIVGLPFRYQLKPMRFDLTSGSGTTKGSLKTFKELVISFYETGNANYGRDVDNLLEIDWRTEEAYGSPPALYTGDKVVTCDGGFDPEDPIVVSGNDPVPCTVRAMIPRITMTGR